jgi:anaerobic magnesium-protoporphyrin IX monomethyl ester cyclase
MFEAKPTKLTRVAIISLSNPFNIGARHLSSLSKTHGFDTHMIFIGAFLKNDILPPTDTDIELMTDLLVNEIKPDIVGVSVSCSAFFKTSIRITESLKRKGYKGLIAWGGIHSILCHDECIEYCDLAFTGEAENPWVEFLDRVEKHESFSDLKGAWVKDADGTIHKNPLAEFVENLDEVPFPDYDNDRHYYIGEGKLERIEPFRKELFSIFVLSSRGCPFHCSFCATPRIFADLKKEKHIGKYIRQRTVDNVIAEIEYIEKSFPDFKASKDGTINFGDDVFVLYKDWVTEFTKKYQEKFDRPYWCYFHPNTVNEKIVELLAGTGLTYIDMGIQSGNERVRRELFLRTDTNENIRKAVDIIHQAKVGIVMDMITDNPFDTEEDKQSGLDFLLTVRRPFTLNYLSMIMFPKVRFTEMALEAGLITEADIEQNRMKIFEQWETKYDWKGRSRNELFWIALYSMTGKSFIPRWYLKLLAKIPYFRKNPSFIVWSARRASNIVWLDKRSKIFWHRLFTGQIRFSDIMYSFNKYRRIGLPQE